VSDTIVKFVSWAIAGVALGVVGAIVLGVNPHIFAVALGYSLHFAVMTGLLQAVLYGGFLLVALGLPLYILVRIVRAAWPSRSKRRKIYSKAF
jgi:hypothetical protein